MRVVLVAEEAAGVHALRLLAGRDEQLVAVLSSPPPASGTTVATEAERIGVPRLDPGLVRDPAFADWLAEQRVDLLLNVHSLRIADAAVLAAPRIGSFNLHPGPLPAFAGLNAPSWAIAAGEIRHAVTLHWMTGEVDGGAIAAGEIRHAVTLHWMTGEVDGGAIAYEAWFDVGPADTGLRVATRCAREGVALLGRLLDDAARDAIPARAQVGERRWYGREVPHGGRLPWALGARAVADLVRAADYAPFPSPWGTFTTRAGDAELEVVRVARTDEATDAAPGTVGPVRDGGVLVSAGDEWVLVERVRRDGAAVPPAEALHEIDAATLRYE